MTSIGETLRAQRLKQGITLDHVSSDIKIGTRLLEAIESNDFEKLPGGVFRKSFILQYARTLGVDPEWVASELNKLELFQEKSAAPGEQPYESPSVTVPPLVPERDWTAVRASVGSFLAVIGVVIACATLYTWWQDEQTSRASTAKQEQPAVSAPAPVPAGQPPPVAAPSTETGGTATAPPKPAEASAAPPATQAHSAVRVDLTANEQVWVQATSDGKRVFADAMQAKQTKTFEANESVRLLLGNAGGLVISLNGKEIPAVGPRGQIRLVELKADGYQVVSRNPPTEPL
jgi:cytoskeletal protein RodZ